MNGWVGLNPLRVQALMTKIQSEKAQISELENRIAAIQNSISWEIAAKNDVDETLRRARNKIRRRAELLAELENSMRDAVDTFTATDKRRTKNQSTLEYWSTLVGGSTAVAGLSSLAMTGVEALLGKVGSIFGTGSRDTLVNIRSELVSNPPMKTTPASKQDTVAEAVMRQKLGLSSRDFLKNEREIIEEAKQRGLNGEKPKASGLISETEREAYRVQLTAWKSTLSSEELAKYEAEKQERKEQREKEKAEKEKNKSIFEKAADKLGKVAEKVGDKISEGTDFIGQKVEDIAESTGDFIVHGIEDGKELYDNVTKSVNDYLDEHPAAKYGVAIAKDGLEVVGDIAGFAGDVYKGEYEKAFISGVSMINNTFNMYQDADALLNYGFAKISEGIGASDAMIQSYYDYAEESYALDGLEGQLRQGGEVGNKIADGYAVLETAGNMYSGAMGFKSIWKGLGNAKSIEEGLGVLTNWKEVTYGSKLGEKIGFYDNLFSNIGLVSGTGEELLDHDTIGTLAEIFSPVKSGKKFLSFLGLTDDEE